MRSKNRLHSGVSHTAYRNRQGWLLQGKEAQRAAPKRDIRSWREMASPGMARGGQRLMKVEREYPNIAVDYAAAGSNIALG